MPILSVPVLDQPTSYHSLRYLCLQSDGGILLGEASHGNLQTYIDEHHALTLVTQRLLWCRQLAEALVFIHSHGVLHSDLRPGNILVHETVPGAQDLLLADFGGSVCEELGLDGMFLPDGPFYSPVFNWQSSELVDIFGMGSVFYTIHTGWSEKVDDQLEWEDTVVYPNFAKGKFPDNLGDLPGGNVILACWKREFGTAKDALTALDKFLENRSKDSEPTTVLDNGSQ